MPYTLWLIQGLLALLLLCAGGVKLVRPLDALKGPFFSSQRDARAGFFHLLL